MQPPSELPCFPGELPRTTLKASMKKKKKAKKEVRQADKAVTVATFFKKSKGWQPPELREEIPKVASIAPIIAGLFATHPPTPFKGAYAQSISLLSVHHFGKFFKGCATGNNCGDIITSLQLFGGWRHYRSQMGREPGRSLHNCTPYCQLAPWAQVEYGMEEEGAGQAHCQITTVHLHGSSVQMAQARITPCLLLKYEMLHTAL